MIDMIKYLISEDTMLFSHVVTLGKMNEATIKNDSDKNSSKSILIDVLLMLLCEQIDNNPTLQDKTIISD